MAKQIYMYENKINKILRKENKEGLGNYLTIYNPGQNIWNRIEKSSKTGQDKKSLISTFACFSTATAKVWFLEGGLGTNVSTQIWDFPNFPLFSKILSLKSFGNSWGKLYTKFVIIDITFRLTCG